MLEQAIDFGRSFGKSLLWCEPGKYNVLGVEATFKKADKDDALFDWEPKNKLEKKILSIATSLGESRPFSIISSQPALLFARLLSKSLVNGWLTGHSFKMIISSNGSCYTENVSPEEENHAELAKVLGEKNNIAIEQPIEAAATLASSISDEKSTEITQTSQENREASADTSAEPQFTRIPLSSSRRNVLLLRNYFAFMTPSTAGMMFLTAKLVAGATLMNFASPLAYVTAPIAVINGCGAVMGMFAEFVNAYQSIKTKCGDFHEIQKLGKAPLAIATATLVSEFALGLFLAGKVANFI